MSGVSMVAIIMNVIIMYSECAVGSINTDVNEGMTPFLRKSSKFLSSIAAVSCCVCYTSNVSDWRLYFLFKRFFSSEAIWIWWSFPI